MAGAVIEIDRPLSTAAVLLGGLATLAKRGHGRPVLPDVRLVRRAVAIDPAHLADYRTLCGFDPAGGIPATYPHLLAFPLHLRLMMRRDFPYPMAGLVHIANRIVQHRALRAGERPDVSVAFGPLLAHPRGQALTIRASLDVGGATIWESESVYLRIGAPALVGDPVPLLEDPRAHLMHGVVEDLPASIASRYARISGDRNPIHMSNLGARLFGFKRRIVHGMWTKAHALALALPDGIVERIAVDVNFRAPILLPGAAIFQADAGQLAVRDAAGERVHLIGRYTLDPMEKPSC
jgi:hypothetical protein